MSTNLAVAGVLLAAVIAYALLAGADFGGGVWDLFAFGPRKAAQRRAIADAMAPVWEANHVWLIFVIVIVFSCFPSAFAQLTIGMFVPFHLALVGITLRGAAFVFRAYGPKGHASRWGAVFGVSSVVTPFVLGMVLGSVSTGRFPEWLAPLPIVDGALALAMCAYLASVYLAYETAGDLREDYRRRALVIGGVVVALSVVCIPIARHEAPRFFESLFGLRAFPVAASGAVAALVSGWAILTRRYALARWTAGAHVGLLLLGWGLAQFPYIVFPTHAIGVSGNATARFMLRTLPFGALLLGPSLVLLFRVFKSRA